MIITDLENLIHAITLAKINPISPAILDEIDIKEMIFKHFRNATVADILEVASITK